MIGVKKVYNRYNHLQVCWIDKQSIDRCRGEAFGRETVPLNKNTYIQMLRPAPQIAYMYEFLSNTR